MTPNQAKQIILARFTAEWPTLSGSIPFTFDNEKFEPPETGAWARVTIRNLNASQDTFAPKGDREYKRPALLFVEVFTPLDKGTKQGDDLATAARGLYEGENLSGVIFYEGTVRESGRSDKWFRHVAEVRFDYYERK